MKIVIPDFIDISDARKTELKNLNATIYEDVPDDTTLVDRIKDAELITVNYIDLTAEVIDQAPELKYIVVPAVGYDWIDYKYAASKGIKVLNCPTHNSRAVAEHAIALLLALARQLIMANESLKQSNWEPKTFTGFELQGKKLGLIGYGNIGKQIAEIAEHGFGMTVRFVNSKSAEDQIDSLVKESDVVLLCLPLTPKTKNLMNVKRLELMQPGSVLVNIARGAIVDQNAIKEALVRNKIAGAALDVFVGESLTGKASQDIVDLARLPNVVATPHIAFNTAETRNRLGRELVDTIMSCQEGNPINIVA